MNNNQAEREIARLVETIKHAAASRNIKFQGGESDKDVWFEFETTNDAEKIYGLLPNNFRLELEGSEIRIWIRDVTGY